MYQRKKLRERSGDGNVYIDPEDYPCPYCGSDDYNVRYIQGGEWIGCDQCIKSDWL